MGKISTTADIAGWACRTIEANVIRVIASCLGRLLKAVGGPLARFFTLLLFIGGFVLDTASTLKKLFTHVYKWMMIKHDLSSIGGEHFKNIRGYFIAFNIAILIGMLVNVINFLEEQFSSYKKHRREILEKMKMAATFNEWFKCSKELRILDKKYGHSQKDKYSAKSNLYTKSLFQDKIEHFQKVFDKEKGMIDIDEMVSRLRDDLIRNFGKMHESDVYETLGEIPSLIMAYVNHVNYQLNYIADTSNYPIEKKLAFFQETRHVFGRSALLLSGGGALGVYHLGVVKALLAHDHLPRIIGGSSAGAIVSSLLGCYEKEELKQAFDNLENIDLEFFSNSSMRQYLGHLLLKGHLHDSDFFCEKLKKLLKNITFLEAYEKTGRILNVVVSAADTNEPTRVLNYLTAPHVLVWSAVAASSAFPGLFPAHDILAKNNNGDTVKFSCPLSSSSCRRWRDGSLEEDLPVKTLREMFNVNYFIVSQTNPHIIPLLSFKNRFTKTVAKTIETEFKHRCQQLQWILPSFIPTKWLSLFYQTWEGDVTMTLPFTSYWTLAKAVVNPTKEDLLSAAHTGEVCTWEKMTAIKCNTSIEMTLDECLTRVVHDLRECNLMHHYKANGIRSRIPSWLHMPITGQQMNLANGMLTSIGGNNSVVSERCSVGSSVQRQGIRNSIDCIDESSLSILDSTSLTEGISDDHSDENGLNVIAP